MCCNLIRGLACRLILNFYACCGRPIPTKSQDRLAKQSYSIIITKDFKVKLASLWYHKTK